MVKRPGLSSEEELREFERLVREGFGGSDDGLPARIRRAHRLAIHRSSANEPIAIAGLKSPDEDYRSDLFERSETAASATDYLLELGWVYVLPEHRGRRLGERLCRRLVNEPPTGGLFATTRPDNEPMIRILRALGFIRTGRPFCHPRRDEELALFLRRQGADEAAASLA
ncbi:MAG: GNAT family N-acetyltransferase [Thermoanaerobaculia bacterium]|nr:GNAT family N-acetyltransferase [Thermoanaerobaculia bacterium]